MGQQPDRPPPVDLPLRELLEELGYGGGGEAAARRALEEAGLTRAGKQRIASRKREEVTRTLRERFALSCQRPACQSGLAAQGRAVLPAQRPTDCEACGGSDNRKAVDRLCQALAALGLRRVCVVGGSPSAREAMAELVGERLHLRLVEGVGRRTRAEARADLLWADLVVIWGGTQLDHKVSTLYTDPGEDKVLGVHRRGVAALADELVGLLKGR